MTTCSLDIAHIRQQFPALHQQVYGQPLAYLDNAATTQKPQAVIDALTHYYCHDNANVHRGVHTLAERTTTALEKTRQALKTLLNASAPEEIIFTAGATASLNLVASTYGQAYIKAGDEILVSHMEHHANLVPWQMLCQAKGATLKVIPVSDAGELEIEAFEQLLTPQTKLVAITHVSNTLGTINPIKDITQRAHAQRAIVVVDGSQAPPHFAVDVQDLNCDFFVCSAHKMYGPTGVGVLYGKSALLEAMPPYQGGGAMIQEVTLQQSTYTAIPYKFEAGTPPIASIIAFGRAIDFIQQTGYALLAHHETQLSQYAHALLEQVKNVRLIGQASHKVGIITFVVNNMHHLDVGMLLDAQGIAVRTGHSCTQPLMQRFGVEGVVRASLAVYNTMKEVERLADTVARIAHRHTHSS